MTIRKAMITMVSICRTTLSHDREKINTHNGDEKVYNMDKNILFEFLQDLAKKVAAT